MYLSDGGGGGGGIIARRQTLLHIMVAILNPTMVI